MVLIAYLQIKVSLQRHNSKKKKKVSLQRHMFITLPEYCRLLSLYELEHSKQDGILVKTTALTRRKGLLQTTCENPLTEASFIKCSVKQI